MKPIDVKSDFYAEYNEDSKKKDPIFKVGDHVRISKYKNIICIRIAQKKFLTSAKLKKQFLGHILLVISMVKKLLDYFMERKCKRQIKKTLEQKKQLKGMSNGKVMITHLKFGLIRKILYKISQYFSKPYESFGGNINVKVD